MKTPKIIPAFLLFAFFVAKGYSQAIPSTDENIPYLVTFGKNAEKIWGDDDFIQVFFFSVPEGQKDPIYIRVFDPEAGNTIDELKGVFNTRTKYTIYGGTGTHSNPEAQKPTPTGQFRTGVQLATKTFSANEEYDGKWYTFGPFNPNEGELQTQYGGYIFKLIIEGLDGDDGNLYNLFVSNKSDENIPIEGGNAFAYSYCCRLSDKMGFVSHLYPFVDKSLVSIQVHTFDYDNDGIIRIVSVARKGENVQTSSDGNWIVSKHKVSAEEVNTSLDVQIIKRNDSKNNNVVLYITNQYGEAMPFYAAPIGGVPKYKPKIKAEKISPK
jgi:hypothetical protein